MEPSCWGDRGGIRRRSRRGRWSRAQRFQEGESLAGGRGPGAAPGAATPCRPPGGAAARGHSGGERVGGRCREPGAASSAPGVSGSPCPHWGLAGGPERGPGGLSKHKPGVKPELGTSSPRRPGSQGAVSEEVPRSPGAGLESGRDLLDTHPSPRPAPGPASGPANSPSTRGGNTWVRAGGGGTGTQPDVTHQCAQGPEGRRQGRGGAS